MSKAWKEYGRYGTIGIEFVLSLAVGYFGGKYVDERFGLGGWGTGIGTLVGVYAGFRTFFVAAKRMTADAERADREERERYFPKPQGAEAEKKAEKSRDSGGANGGA